MSYNTFYELSFGDPDAYQRQGYLDSTNLSEETVEQIGEEIERFHIFEQIDLSGASSGNNSWSSCDTDMTELSAKFPGVLFFLTGVGDAADDLWQTFYLGGKMQHCPGRIVYDEFDPEKLKEAR